MQQVDTLADGAGELLPPGFQLSVIGEEGNTRAKGDDVKEEGTGKVWMGKCAIVIWKWKGNRERGPPERLLDGLGAHFGPVAINTR